MKSVLDFFKKKKLQEKITMVTCYDYGMAKILSQTKVDVLLVGDSLAQTVHGFPNTLHATIDMMALHTAAVARGTDQFIVADMPFLSHRKGNISALGDAQKLMVAGAHAIKIEGVHGHADVIKYIVESGIPVMGHLGLTPQSIYQLGGPKIQGKTAAQAEDLIQQAQLLVDSGCFAIVLECIPSDLAKKITEKITVPTIGIGAGASTDGQVLVINDLLGMNAEFNPKFLKKYSNLNSIVTESVNTYVEEVNQKKFPDQKHEYSV